MYRISRVILKTGNNEKTCQNVENKQTVDLTRKIEFQFLEEKLVKPLKKKLLI